MSSNAIIHAFQYKQLSTYVSEAINAFYLQDTKVLETMIERLSILSEKLGYELKYTYTIRDDAISSFNLDILKESFILVNFKATDRVSYLSKQIEEKKIQTAKANGIEIPKQVEEQIYSGGTNKVIDTNNVSKQVEIVKQPEPLVNSSVEVKQPEVKPKARIKLVNGKLVKIED